MSMKTKRELEVPAKVTTPPGVLNGTYQDKAYGVSFIPWDARIALEPPPTDVSDSPRFKGFVPLADRLVPVFDLREAPASAADAPKATTYLLVVAMCTDATGPIQLGLLVQEANGQFNIPADTITNLARRN
jgi:CheW-like domain